MEALRADSPDFIRSDAAYVEFMNAPSATERQLSGILAAQLPFFTVAHPGNRFVRPDPGWLPRLQVADAAWRDIVASLMRQATLIVVELVHLSPGLREELELLQAQGVASRTVLVLAGDSSEEASQYRLQQQLFDRFVDGVEISGDDPTLLQFRRVVSVNSFRPDAPALADLLYDAVFVRDLSPSQRAERNNALGVLDDAAGLLASVQRPTDSASQQAAVSAVAQAALKGMDALTVLAALGDRMSEVQACTLLALATAMLGDADKLNDALGWLLTAAAPLDASQRAGLVMRLPALAQLPLDDTTPSTREQAGQFSALFPTLQRSSSARA